MSIQEEIKGGGVRIGYMVLLFPVDREGVFSFSLASRDGGENAGDTGLERGCEGVK
jgi:hypothetical protein